MKKVLIGLLVIIIIAFGVLAKYLIDRATIFTGFAAKNVASGIFIAGRTQESIEALDINFFPVNLAKTTVDMDAKTVTSNFYGFGKQTAVYRDGIGVALIGDMDINTVKNQSCQECISKDYQPDVYWPQGDKDRDTVLSFVNEDKLNNAIESAMKQGNTRAIIVAYDTLLKWEKYGDGFDETTPILGWSMSKSITSTMIGVLVKENKLQLDKPAPIKEWANDERVKITLRNLLNMTSGLKWVEDYGDISEATIMLYNSAAIAQYALKAPAEFSPDSVWYYSSGTSNILQEIIRRQFDDVHDYWAFPHKAIFHKIGMNHTIMETDAVGTYVGSSYTYGPARDWCRYGLLYLNNGIWRNDTIIDPSWVEFTHQEAPNSDGQYGAQFWLNLSGNELPDAPKDIYYADGYQGQRVYIIPSRKLVIVRFGISKHGEFDYNKMVTSILDAFDK
jgi:CubicO group peptidase (beta-lactamase class C family)